MRQTVDAGRTSRILPVQWQRVEAGRRVKDLTSTVGWYATVLADQTATSSGVTYVISTGARTRQVTVWAIPCTRAA